MEKFIKTPFAFLGDRSEIPDPIQNTGDVSMMTGYGYDYERDQLSDTNAKNIERQKMNWLFYIITRAISEYQSSGVPEFITTVMNGGNPYPYQKSALVRFNSGIYYSLVDNNTATPEDNTKWAQLMYSNEDIFDGYLRIDKLLSEIAEQGANAQKQARENIGIDGDIAYRNKENTFKEKNTFIKPTQFNDDVTVAAGKKINAPTIWLTYNGEKMGALSGSVGDTVNLISDAKLLLGGATVHDLKYLAGNTEYEVWHAGNYDPVRTVNYIGPDKNGNVQIEFSPPPNHDGAYAMITYELKIDASTGIRKIIPIYGSELVPGSQVLSGGARYGIWQPTTGGGGSLQDPTMTALSRRYPVGNLDKLKNLRNPEPYYSGSAIKGWTLGLIDLTCNIDGVEDDVIFTASSGDCEEYGRQVYANAIAGMYGEIPPDPGTLK
ncbi:hypothetical protein ACT6MH_000081 [Escherichia coli]|uniref:hypothetical protein n=1 Tax=Escherichia coli TaxID=562 RepID=UPI0015E942F1|nr:hypothetical protein [Escherichia coli]EIL6174284.1 hypothetical protein [Escherichia coli]ELG9149507.1 hypothetical protein [Escherichia coli]MBB6952937.1 hypothetical protein [Escherichia coli]MBB7543954.1 hypothetical protein [Escherichia coli]MDS1687094.1 hypothetical protein [Escherichia coli]